MREMLRSIAQETRAELEAINTNWWNAELCGACGVAAFVITAKVRARGVRARFVMGHDSYATHCWTEVYANRRWLVIDVTATQFKKGLPSVIVVDFSTYARTVFEPKGIRYDQDAIDDMISWTQPEIKVVQHALAELSRLKMGA